MPARTDEGRARPGPAPLNEGERLVARAGVVGAGTLLSRLLGFGRDIALAAFFTRTQIDAFAVALTIPNALRQLLAEGAVSSAVVPVLSARIANGGDEEGRAFFARARGVSLLTLTIVSVLGVVFAMPLTQLFAGGYEGQKLELTAQLTRVMFPYIFFMGVAALGMAALNAKRRFAVAAFAPGLFNVAIIAAAIVARDPIGLAVGVLVGGVLQVVAQVPALRKIGYAGRPRLDLRDPHVRDMLRRILPMTFGLGVYYVDLVLSRRFLSELGEGAQAAFFFASRLCDFPQGIFVMALSTAALPSLATFAAKGDEQELAKTWAHGMRLSLFVAVPCSVALVVLAEPVVIALFERGHFDAVSSAATARALAWQGSAVFSVAASRQLVPAFHSLGDTRTPVIVSAIDLAVFIGLALGLRGTYGAVAISMAVAGSSFAQTALLAAALKVRLGTVREREIFGSLVRIAAASAVAAVAGRAASALVPRGISGIAGGAVFVVVFIAGAWSLRARELGEIAAPIRRRFAR